MLMVSLAIGVYACIGDYDLFGNVVSVSARWSSSIRCIFWGMSWVIVRCLRRVVWLLRSRI